jgi:LPXTG-motif cell wall-anchored protein
MGVAVDSLGDVYIADSSNSVVRRVGLDGIITTVAGNYALDQASDGAGGFSGDGGPATSAQLNSPWGLTLDRAGDLFIADTFNHAIREVTPAGVISTLVNTSHTAGNSTSGTATAAKLNTPYAVGVDNSTGVVYIADTHNSRIKAVNGIGVPGPAAGGPVAPGPNPQLPESPLPILLPAVGLALAAGAGAFGFRRRRRVATV